MKLVHLENINISNNHLTSIPEYFGNFDLTEVIINAQNNNLVTLPDTWNGKQVTQFHLYLSGNTELGFLNTDFSDGGGCPNGL